MHYSKFIVGKCAGSSKLLSVLSDVAAVDLQVAVTLLHMCGSFCRMVHIARANPPSLTTDALKSNNEEVNSALHYAQPLKFPLRHGARHSLV